MLNFVVYAGSDSHVTKMDDKYLGKSAEVVLTLLKSYLGKGHTLFVDNWYTSPTLFNYLYNNKTNVCDTVKPRRKDMPVLSEKLLPTCHSADYVTRKKINYRTGERVQKPSCIVDYSINMGAVDNRNKV